MSKFNEIRDEITDLIYQGVLGMTRDEVIAEASILAGDGHEFYVTDKDESARDYLSEEALRGISIVEDVLADFISEYGMPERNSILAIARNYRVSKVWDK